MSNTSDPVRGLFLGITVADTLATLWLVNVAFLVLPVRDPSHAWIWQVVTSGYVALMILSWSWVAGARGPLMRIALWICALAGAAWSVVMGAETLRAMRAGRDFEGSVLLLSLLLAAHALLALLDLTRSPR